MGGVDLLFNNAGVYLGGPMRRATLDDWRFVLDVNLDGAFRVGQTFTRLMLEQGRGGYVVNTASVGGFLSHGAGVAYAVSKYGMVAYSEAMRADLEPDGIVGIVQPPSPVGTSLEPPAADQHDDGITLADACDDGGAPLVTGHERVDVAEHAPLTELVGHVIVEAPCGVTAVFPTVADEDSRHGRAWPGPGTGQYTTAGSGPPELAGNAVCAPIRTGSPARGQRPVSPSLRIPDR